LFRLKISLLFEHMMVKILTFFLGLVLLSYYITNVVVFSPLELIKTLNSAFGYVAIIFGIALTIWLMGD